jgi:hypothetical protein
MEFLPKRLVVSDASSPSLFGMWVKSKSGPQYDKALSSKMALPNQRVALS